MEAIKFSHSFMAIGSDGEQYAIDVFTSYAESNTSSGFVSTPGQKILRKSKGGRTESSI